MKTLSSIRRLLASIAIAAVALAAAAQDDVAPAATIDQARIKPVKGYYMTNIDDEDVMMIVLNEVTVFPPMKFKNKKEEDFYWKTVRDVRKALPYAKVISDAIVETYEYIATFPTDKERDDYLKKMEGAIFKQYKPHLKQFTKSQAVMLCKLTTRETDQSSYHIIKAFLGTFRAGFWNAFGKFFGVNLKTKYQPQKDKNDAIIERVATLVELGQL